MGGFIQKKKNPQFQQVGQSLGPQAEVYKYQIRTDIFFTTKQGSFTNFYQLQKLLGSGLFSQIRLAIHKSSGYKRAIKQYHKQTIIKVNEEQKLVEANILKELDHPNIIKIYELFEDQQSYFLINEYLEGEDLFTRITTLKHLTERMAAEYMKQILSGLMYLHENQIVHRDLKPESIVFENKKPNSNLKIVSFGLARRFESNKNLTQKLGTPYYIAPEVLKRNYNEKCDVWSCGVTLYIMLCGYPPFGGQDQEILQNIEIGEYEFDPEDWSKISDDAKNLIKKMLTKDYNERISAQEAFNDPWIQKNAPNAPIDFKAIKNLSSFFWRDKITALLMHFISTNLIKNEEKEALLNEFKKIDKDGNGQISKEELIQGKNKINIVYQKKYNEIQANEIVEDIFERVDTNKSGNVNFTQFITAALGQEKLLNKTKLQQAFKIFDLNGDGYINRDDFEEIMGKINDNLWKEMLALLDSNGDGQISQKEFIDIVVNKYD